MFERDKEIIIIGAGVSGLTAARVLKSAGRKVKIIEATDGIGGRVRTDEIDGYLLDRGFQVLLTAYPEAKRFLDYKSLNLRSFLPGAMILNEKGCSEIGDPLRNPSLLFKTITSPAGTFADKMRMMSLKLKLSATSIDKIFNKSETTTIAYLHHLGFSQKIIDQFFKPFMSGIFLENQLHTSSRMFEYVFKLFSEDDTAVPARGMGMIPKQLAQVLEDDEIILNEKVVHIDGTNVITNLGRAYEADQVLIATEATHMPMPFHRPAAPKNSVTNIYFTADKAPFTKPFIALNAIPNQLVNNVAVMNQISPYYAPEDKALISVSIIRDVNGLRSAELISKVMAELQQWFPDCISWKHLKTYYIPYALPKDEHVENDIAAAALKLRDNVFICGDHLLNGSINAAMRSGRLAAEAILSL